MALKGDTFRAFFTFLFQVFPESQAKLLANSFIKELGRKYSRSDHGFTCKNMDTAECIWTSDLAEGRNITIDNYKDLFLSREQKVERIFSDDTSINRFVISEAILKCPPLILDNYSTESILYSVNTDEFYIKKTPKVTYPSKKDIKFKVKNIEQAFMTDSKPTYFEKHYRENLDVNNYKSIKGNCYIYHGQASCGKITKLCEMVINAENRIILSYTNKAVEMLKRDSKICARKKA